MDNSLGKLIRAAREGRGWTQEELATKVGVKRPYISKIENDEKVPARELLRRFTEALELDPAAVLGLSTPPSTSALVEEASTH